MANVLLQGVFMGVNLKTSSFDGKEKSALYIDLYQPDSTDAEKTLSVKADDVSLIGKLHQEYAMGSLFSCKASVNAYKNKAYYKLVDILTA
jgi:hypothetical protein